MSHRSQNWRPLALSLISTGAIARLIPHAPNFTPVGAISLYSGARLRSWQAYLVPILAMAITDPIMAAISGYRAFTPVTAFVYLSFVLNVWIGEHLCKAKHAWQVGGAALAGSVQFFIITNFGMWATRVSYPHTLTGLAECYLAGIPFFRFTLAGDLAYTAILFGLHSWLSRRYFPRECAGAETVLP